MNVCDEIHFLNIFLTFPIQYSNIFYIVKIIENIY